MKFEKRPLNNEEDYLVIGTFAMSVAKIKAILLLWVFFAVVFFTYAIGVYTAQENVKMTAYLLKGNLTNDNGEEVFCNPVMEKKVISWNCSTNLTEEITVVARG